MASINSMPQIYMGGNPSTRPHDTMGMAGIKKKPLATKSPLSPAQSKNMLNKARSAGGDANKFMPSRTQGVI